MNTKKDVFVINFERFDLEKKFTAMDVKLRMYVQESCLPSSKQGIAVFTKHVPKKRPVVEYRTKLNRKHAFKMALPNRFRSKIEKRVFKNGILKK